MLAFGSKYQKFWKWFQMYEDEIVCFEADRERVFDKLANRLRRVHRDLTFEFSSIINARREFIVSAGGIKSAFAEASTLVREAPALHRWQIIAFRQRKDLPTISYGGKTIQRESVFFDYVSTDDKIDLTVFMPGLAGCSEEETTVIKTIGYRLLDTTVGEYDVETKIAGIQFVDGLSYPEKRRIPLRELPAVVDNLPGTIQ
jgi:hypothetical protein